MQNSFFRQLLQRKVVRTAIWYVAGGVALIEAADLLMPRMGLPDMAVTVVMWAVIGGLPLALLLSWFWDINPSEPEVDAGSALERQERGGKLERPDVAMPERGHYVGRTAEREQISTAIDRALQGEGSLFMIGGEPGVGKSRLAEEALAIGHDCGMLPLTGHAYEERGAPFVSTTEILEELDRLFGAEKIKDLVGEASPELLKLMPGWRSLFPDARESSLVGPEQQQRHLFNDLLRILVRLCSDMPLVIMIDDMHWADESSMLLLEHLMPRLSGLRLVFVLTYRDIEADQTDAFRAGMARLVRSDRVQLMPLRLFDESEVSLLLESLGGSRPPGNWVRAIAGGTEGNPFFVREVFAHLRESGQLLDDRGNWLQGDFATAADVPESVRMVIGRRIDRLGTDTCDVLLVAAAFGLQFNLTEVEITAGVRGIGGETVLDELEAAEKAGLLSVLPGRQEVQYRFAHALVRQTLLERLSLPRLQRLHGLIAAELDRHYGQESEQHAAALAHHYYEAASNAPAERTRHFLRLAGQRAAETTSYGESLEYCNRALSLSNGLGDHERSRLLFLRGAVHRALHRWDKAAQDWMKALPILEEQGDVPDITTICREIGYFHVWAGRMEEAYEIGDRGMRALGSGPSEGRCRLLAMQAHGYSLSTEFERSRLALEEAIGSAEKLGLDRVLGSEVLLSEIFRCEHSSRGREMLQAADRAIPLVRAEGSAWDQSSVICSTLLGSLYAGRLDEASRRRKEIMPVAEQEGNIGSLVHCYASGGMIASLRGNYAQAVERLQVCESLCRQAGFPYYVYAQAWRSMPRLYSGDFEGALHDASLAREEHIHVGSHRGGDVACTLSVMAMLGHNEARGLLEDDFPLAEPGRDNGVGSYHWTCATILTAAVLGERETAARLLPVAQQLMDLGTHVLWAMGFTCRHAGIAAACAGDHAAASRYFEQGMELAQQVSAPVETVQNAIWKAWALQLQGRHGEAQPMLKMASVEARNIRMNAFAERLSRVLKLGWPGMQGGETDS